jgi:uncharacterized protein (TIGR02217 family)
MAFFEVEFPRKIAFGSAGGDRFSTTRNRGFSGGVQPNRNWAKSLAYFIVDLTAKSQDYFELVHNFFLNVGGGSDGFRFWWPLDHPVTNQIIATADGSANPVYQLIKTYTIGSRTYTRTVVKPITSDVKDFEGTSLEDTVVLYDNGSTPSWTYVVDETTGLVTVTGTPGSGHSITADFEFHIPVRFDVDDMKSAQLLESNFSAGNGVVNWTQLGMEEIR